MARWTSDELEFLRNSYLNMTDAEIALKIGKDEKSITNKRTRMGFFKNLAAAHEDKLTSVYTITDEQKKNIAVKNFRESRWYKNAEEILLKTDSFSELQTYEDKWVGFITNSDELTPTEQESLHIMILMSIRVDRYHRLEKMSLVRALEQTNPDLRRDFQKEIRECAEQFAVMQKNLHATREQRIKEQGQKTLSFLTLLREMTEREKESRISREAAALEYNASMQEKDYIKKGYLITAEEPVGSGI